MQLTTLLAGLTLLPVLSHASPLPMTSPSTSTTSVNLLLNYGNDTLVWYNGTIVPSEWNFYNVTNQVTNGNIGSVFFAAFGSHFVYSINNAGCPASNIFCDPSWSLWTLDGVCWDIAQTGVDQIFVTQTKTVAWFLTPVSTFGEFPPTGVNCLNSTIDAKPGSISTVINIASQGTIPVAILSTPGFDATKVNPVTVRFGQTGTEASAISWSLQDVNGDGTLDLVLHFSTQNTGFTPSDTQAVLMGRLLDGTPFRGFSQIQTITSK